MPDSPKTSRKIAAHLAGVGIYILIALAGMIAFVLFYKATEPREDALAGGAIVLFLPMTLLAFGLVVWAPAWAIMKRKWGNVTPRKALKIAALLSFLGTLLFCGRPHRAYGGLVFCGVCRPWRGGAFRGLPAADKAARLRHVGKLI